MESTGHFGTKLVTLSEKVHVKSALVFGCLLYCEITLALVCVVEAVPTDEKDKGNTGNSILFYNTPISCSVNI